MFCGSVDRRGIWVENAYAALSPFIVHLKLTTALLTGYKH